MRTCCILDLLVGFIAVVVVCTLHIDESDGPARHDRSLQARNATTTGRFLERSNHHGLLFTTPRIINGKESAADAHPYFATRWSASFVCGASLVAPDILLTAAHCNDAFTSDALVGALFRDSQANDAQVVTVVKQIPHPNFLATSTEVRNDIMVMKISPPVTSKEPIRLNLNPNLPSSSSSRSLTVIGMGLVSDTPGDFPERLIEAQVFATSKPACERFWWPKITTTFLCAWNNDKGRLKTACGGDSGSALIDDRTGSLVGIVSFGAGDCTTGIAPAVFTRVSAYKNWLRTKICANSDNPPANLECGCKLAKQMCSKAATCCGNRLKCKSSKCVQCSLKGKQCRKSADCCTGTAMCKKNKCSK